MDAWVALSKRKPVFYTHGFVEINIMIEAVIFVLHEALNFSDSPSAIVTGLEPGRAQAQGEEKAA